jgi:hypothetical protein
MTCPSCGYYLGALENECPKCSSKSANDCRAQVSQQKLADDFLSNVWESLMILHQYLVGWMKKSQQDSQIAIANDVYTPKRNLTCPCCCENYDYPVSNGLGAGIYEFTCPLCSTRFVSRIVTIRSKNSRGSKKENLRRFSVRVYDYATSVPPENLIEFVNHDYIDFEMKSGDIVVFSYHEKCLKIVQNATVNRTYVLK